MAISLVIFGASGDLTNRKLVPALFQLFQKGRTPFPARIVGFSRTAISHEQWRDKLAAHAGEFLGKDFDPIAWRRFAERLFYVAGDLSNHENVRNLDRFLRAQELDEPADRVYYLATAPQHYPVAVKQLGACEMAEETMAFRRVVIEKPFGSSRATAQELNAAVHEVFSERQVYRIDHYLGKETVQNIFVFRFANAIFEPLWNRNYIDHVQITAAEKVDVGRRADYYDEAGPLRDMFQNHLLQLLTVTAMEVPPRYDADLIRNEKVKVLQAIRPIVGDQVPSQTVRAQYQDYRDTPGVRANSPTATFAAVKLHVDNWRWQGVPFYLRTGKAMDCRTTQIVIQFREPPHLLFPNHKRGATDANRLVIHIQPAEGIQLHFQTKVPDQGMTLRLTDLDFRFASEFGGSLPDAYEILLLDVMSGDPSLFARADEVERAWGIVDPIQEYWDRQNLPDLCFYERGMWGPEACRTWMQRDGRNWLDACPILK